MFGRRWVWSQPPGAKHARLCRVLNKQQRRREKKNVAMNSFPSRSGYAISKLPSQTVVLLYFIRIVDSRKNRRRRAVRPITVQQPLDMKKMPLQQRNCHVRDISMLYCGPKKEETRRIEKSF